MAIKLACCNIKGGIGKTTTSLCLADNLQKKGYKVLMIDTDPQRSASSVYQTSTDDVYTLGDIMYNDTPAAECVQHLPLGDIISSDDALVDAERDVKFDTDRFYHLADSCKTVEDLYDFIICDCPPGNNVLLGNVLSYVNYCIIPITVDKFGLQGLDKFPAVMKQYTKRINPTLKILGVLIVKYKGRQNLTRDLEDHSIPELVESMGTRLFTTKIRESVKCQESQALMRPLSEYAPNSTTALDYAAFTNEMLEDLSHEK